MGTTADKLKYLTETKQAIKNAIIEMGVEIDDNTPFREYANKILEITTGVDTTDATAQSNDIILGKTAYSGDVKLVGTYDVLNETIPEVGGSITEADKIATDIVGTE